MLKANSENRSGQASDPVAVGALPMVGVDRRVLLVADSHDQAARQDHAFWRARQLRIGGRRLNSKG